MKWVLNRRTMQMEPEKKTGFRVSLRIGGIMVEDFDLNVQFLINYGTDAVTHCVGCSDRCLHIFSEDRAKRIANEITRVAGFRNNKTKYSDYRLLAKNR